MLVQNLIVEESFFFGKTRKSLKKITLCAYDFRVSADDGSISYKLEFRGLVGGVADKWSDSMFWLMRDIMASTRLMIDAALQDNPGCHCYFDYGDQLVKVNHLSQIFMFHVPWDMAGDVS